MPTVASIHISRAEWNETIFGPQNAVSRSSQDTYRPSSTAPVFMTMAAGCGLGALWAGFPGCAVGAVALPLFGCDSDFRLQAEPTPEITPPSPPDPEKCEEVTITVDCDGDDFTNTFSVCEDDAWAVASACGGQTAPSDEEDCAPQNPEAYPGAPEIACSGADENCDGIGDQEWIPFQDASNDANASAVLSGESADSFGENISTGDLNSDGAMDLMASSGGKVHLFYGLLANNGNTGDVTMTLASDEVPKTSALDFNGDGYDDLAVFVGPDGETSRKIFLIPGPLPQGTTGVDIAHYALLTLVDYVEYLPFFQDMSAIGDLNFDDRDDLVTTSENGAAYIIYGRDFPSEPMTVDISEDPDASRLNTDYIADVFNTVSSGYMVPPFDFTSAAGDLNNDGYRDILVTGWRHMVDATTGEDWLRGMACLLYGPFSIGPEHVLDESNTAILEWDSDKKEDDEQGMKYSFGESLAGLGDVNSDGFDDVMIGYPDANVGGGLGAGLAYLILGGDDLYGTHQLLDVALTLVPPTDAEDPEKSTSGFARILAPAGDVNGDFLADAVVYVDDLAKDSCLSEGVSPSSGFIVLNGLPVSAEELRGQSRRIEDLGGTVYYNIFDDNSIATIIQGVRIYPREIATNPGLYDGSPKSLIFPYHIWFVTGAGTGVDTRTIEVFNHVTP